MSRRPGRPPGPPGQRGREAILEATRELLAEQGIGRVTLRGVAERAGVRAPLVNYYFGSKADLFEAVIAEVAQTLRDRVVEIADHPGSPEERLRAFLSDFVRELAANPFAPRLMTELVLFPNDRRTERFMRDFAGPQTQALLRVVAEGVDEGDFETYAPQFLLPAVIGSCLFYFLGAPALSRILDFDPFDAATLDGYAQAVGDLFLRGLTVREES